MAVALSPIGGAGAQFFDNNGNPLSGGKLYTYEAGTTTPAVTYTTLAGTTPHTNPIILDSAGRVPGGEIWLTLPDFYKFVLKTPADVTLGTWDNIQGYSSGSVAYAATEVQIATAGQTLFVLSSMFYNPGTNTLAVYIDGVNQVVNNSYVESTPTSVTFMSGLHVGAVVKFVNVNVASADASAVTYEPGFVGSVATTVAAKLQQTVSVKDFGAVGDGVADDTAAIQAAINYWRTYNGSIKLTASGAFKITNGIDCIWTANDRASKEIDFSGASFSIERTTSGDGFTFQVQSAAGGIFVTNKKINNIRISVSNANCANAFVIDGGNNTGGTLGYFYASVIDRIEIYPFTSGNGFVVRNNFFESSVSNIDVRNFSNTTGSMILVDQTSGSTGVVSSLKFDELRTDGGLRGMLFTDFADIWLQNAHAGRAQNEGIYITNYQGNALHNVHVEANWQSAGSYVVGNAGLRVDCSNAGGTVVGVFGPYSGGGYQTHAVRISGTSGTTLTVIGGYTQGSAPVGGSHTYFTGATTTGGIVIGGQSYTTDGNVAVTRNTGVRSLVPTRSSEVFRQNGSFANITPSLKNFTYHIILNGAITINAPSFTPQTGDELEFTFEQGGTGSNVITWDGVYTIGALVMPSAYTSIATIRFKYLNSAISGNQWMIASMYNFS